jgi:hypothetical protein
MNSYSIKSIVGLVICLPIMSITAKPRIVDHSEIRDKGGWVYEKTTYFTDGTSKTKRVIPQDFIENVGEFKTGDGCLQSSKNVAMFADGAVCIDGVCKNKLSDFPFGRCSNTPTVVHRDGQTRSAGRNYYKNVGHDATVFYPIIHPEGSHSVVYPIVNEDTTTVVYPIVNGVSHIGCVENKNASRDASEKGSYTDYETKTLPQHHRHELTHITRSTAKKDISTTIDKDGLFYAITRCIKKRGHKGDWKCEEKRVLQDPSVNKDPKIVKNKICVNDTCIASSKFFAEGDIRKFRSNDVCKDAIHTVPRGETYNSRGTFNNYGVVNTYEDANGDVHENSVFVHHR